MHLNRRLTRLCVAAAVAIGGTAAVAAHAADGAPPLPPQKQADADHEAQVMADARAGRLPSQVPVDPALSEPLPSSALSDGWDVGSILQTGQSGQLVGIAETGEWEGISHGTEVAVMAGSTDKTELGSYGPVGVVAVDTHDGKTVHGTVTQYTSAAHAGPWRIVSAKHNVITLHDAGGATFTFDADTKTFQ